MFLVLVRLLAKVAGVFFFVLGQSYANAVHAQWRDAQSRELSVRVGTFLDSGISPQEWERFLTQGGDPFGRKNKLFHMEITTGGDSHKKIRLPMIPADEVVISPTSKYIAIVSSYVSSDGIVVVSGKGKVLFHEFTLCFPAHTCVVADSVSSWYMHGRVEFSSTPDGPDCSVNLYSDADDVESPVLSFNICTMNGEKRTK
jgi:hypothetical protein